MSYTWRQIMYLPNVDFCKFTELAKRTPLYAGVLEIMTEKIPELPFECPMMPRTYSVNYTHDAINNPIENLGKFISTRLLPNGEYRNLVRIHNEKYGEMALFIVHATHYVRLNDENFK